MTCRKFSAAAVLLLIITLVGAGTAFAAILQKGSQIVNLVVPKVNNGNVAFSELYIWTSDGVNQPFVLPANSVLVITKIAWHFQPTDSGLTGLVQLNVGEYYRSRAQVSNGYCGGTDSFLPGAAATNMSATIFLEKVGDATRTPIPGLLSLRMFGYVVPDN